MAAPARSRAHGRSPAPPRRTSRAVSPPGACAAEALRIFLGDEAGREPPLAPARRRPSREARNGRLWRMPSIAKRSSASAWAAIAAARSARASPAWRSSDRSAPRSRRPRRRPCRRAYRSPCRPLGGRRKSGEPPGRRHELARGILGVDARSRPPSPAGLHVLSAPCRAARRRRRRSSLDEVDPGDHLGDGMLDLEPGVHLEEVEALVLPGDELDRAGGIVADRLARARPPARPSAGASPRRAAARAPPRRPSGCGAGSSIRARAR